MEGTDDIDATGNELANRISGNEGDNVLRGGLARDLPADDRERDILHGLGGEDTLHAGYRDRLFGGTGDDTYVLGAAVVEGTSLVVTITEDVDDGVDRIEASVDCSLSGYENVENLFLNGPARYGAGNELANVISGTGKNDWLLGRAGDDTLDGDGGRDSLDGGVGDDTYVLGGSSKIAISDTSGTDLVTSTISRSLQPYGSIEHLRLLGEDDLRGRGNDAANEITGNVGDNVLTGEAGNDSLDGGAGADLLRGGDGRDVLSAGIGDDVLRGGLGRDVLAGGPGRDVFKFNSAAEVGIGSNRDAIVDFEGRFDLIDFSSIDADVGTKGNGSFVFLAMENTSFTGDAGELRWYRQNLIGKSQDKTFIEGDLNGDGTADFRLMLDDLHVLRASHFVL